MDQIGQAIGTHPWFAMASVFVAGVLSSSSPCVLAMIPLMMGFVAARDGKRATPMGAFGYSLAFVAGLSIMFTTMGVFASLAGRVYGEVPVVWNWIVALVCMVLGLQQLGVLRFFFPNAIQKLPDIRGVLGAVVLGLLFGIVSAPCAGPVLVVILTYLAGTGASVLYGALLLLLYALGHSVLILAAGTSTGLARVMVESKYFRKSTEVMRRIAGAIIVMVGVYFARKAML